MAKKKPKKSFGEIVAEDWFTINPKSRTKKNMAVYINCMLPILYMDYTKNKGNLYNDGSKQPDIPF